MPCGLLSRWPPTGIAAKSEARRPTPACSIPRLWPVVLECTTPMTAPAGGGAAVAAPPADARLKALYSVMQSIENKLGGGEGVEGLYGSIKKSGMDKVLECLRSRCCLDSRSVLVDIGAGLGRPLMHALLEPGIAGARGIEIDRIKCDKAVAFLRQATLELQRRGVAGADALVLLLSGRLLGRGLELPPAPPVCGQLRGCSSRRPRRLCRLQHALD